MHYSRYCTEGYIKDICFGSDGSTRFTLTPTSEYSIEVNHRGEKKTFPVFRQKDFSHRIFENGVTELHAGDFSFSAPQGMTLDQLLQMKIHGCPVQISVDSKDSLSDINSIDGTMNRKSIVQASEIRLK